MCFVFRPRNGTEKVFNTILGRERAPAAATEDMFVNGTASSINGTPTSQLSVLALHVNWLVCLGWWFSQPLNPVYYGLL